MLSNADRNFLMRVASLPKGRPPCRPVADLADKLIAADLLNASTTSAALREIALEVAELPISESGSGPMISAAAKILAKEVAEIEKSAATPAGAKS